MNITLLPTRLLQVRGQRGPNFCSESSADLKSSSIRRDTAPRYALSVNDHRGHLAFLPLNVSAWILGACPRSQPPKASFSLLLLPWPQRLAVQFLRLLVELCHGRGGIVLLAFLSELYSECFVGFLKLSDPLEDNFNHSHPPRTPVSTPS